MDNHKERPPTLPDPNLGICYFVRPRPKGEEVKFVLPRQREAKEPEELTVGNRLSKLSSAPPSQPNEEYKGFAYYEAQRQKKQIIAKIIFYVPFFGLLMWWLVPRPEDFNPAPSPEIVPPHPYYHQQIAGKDIRGHYHSWVWLGEETGWIDP